MLLPNNENVWRDIPIDTPYAGNQGVNVDATLSADGKLSAKVHYSMRGENELLLRVAFHQSPKDKWKDLAQLLSISDGFRGQVTTVTASDPYATKEPFIVDYEIAQPKFVDWSKKPVRIPALLPQLGLPDPAAKPPRRRHIPSRTRHPARSRNPHDPPSSSSTTTLVPIGTSVVRDYATFTSQYSAKGQTVTASRHINFLQSQVPADRAADYNAFVRAVQTTKPRTSLSTANHPQHPAPSLPLEPPLPRQTRSLSPILCSGSREHQSAQNRTAYRMPILQALYLMVMHVMGGVCLQKKDLRM